MSSLDVCGELAGGCEVEVIKCGVGSKKQGRMAYMVVRGCEMQTRCGTTVACNPNT